MANDINITVSNMSELTVKAFLDCLFKEGEDTTDYVLVEGITGMFGLHPQRLEEKREFVTAILAELSTDFKEGENFFHLFFTKDDEQWTDNPYVGEQLVVMAIGLGLMEYCEPKNKQEFLPGWVRYLMIK